MPRWEPDTQERLVRAALDLYTEQGYERTTVGDIADRVGVTPRTYFRYFADKREVLFASGEVLRGAILAGTAAALGSDSPYEAILAGVTASRDVFQAREFVLAREAVVATSEELRERELMKLASIAEGLRTLLVEHGSEDAAARMAAVAGVAVLVEAIRAWQGGDDAPFAELVGRAARALRDATASQD